MLSKIAVIEAYHMLRTSRARPGRPCCVLCGSMSAMVFVLKRLLSAARRVVDVELEASLCSLGVQLLPRGNGEAMLCERRGTFLLDSMVIRCVTRRARP